MENASKALLMAGGVLIALILMSFLIKSFSTVKQFEMEKLSQEEQAELIKFNEKYTKYLNQYMYGTELITVINGALDNKVYPISVKIKFGSEYIYKGYVYNSSTKRYEKDEITIKKGTNIEFNNDVATGDDVAKNFIYDLSGADGINTMAFKCTGIGYDDSNGRVNSISFEQKQWGDLY